MMPLPRFGLHPLHRGFAQILASESRAARPPDGVRASKTHGTMNASSAEVGRRPHLKSLDGWQRSRRLKALEAARQSRQSAREDVLRSKRNGVDADDKGGMDVEPSRSAPSGTTEAASTLKRAARTGFARAQKTKRRFAEELGVMEWLIDVPNDLHEDWYVLARPEGKRCLMIAEHGGTTTRLKNGSPHMQFLSPLPNGCPRSRDRRGRCLLDAVYHENANTFYLVDCMEWDGMSLRGCDFEFRRFWLEQKLGEVDPTIPSDYGLRLIPLEVATRDAIGRAYREALEFEKDGFIFIHREFPHDRGQSPLCLQWKDKHCSRYPVDTDAKGKALERQHVVLRIGGDGATVETGDAPPIALGTLPSGFLEKHTKSGLDRDVLLRFGIGPGGIHLGPDGRPTGADLEMVGACLNRSAPDLLSRIVFQHMCRMEQQVSIDELL